MLYKLGATIAGLLAGGCTVALIEGCNSLLHPMPEGLRVDDAGGMTEWVRSLPTSAFLVLLAAWGAGAFVGTFVARRTAPSRAVMPALIVGVLLTLATTSNLLMLPHPWWLWPTGLGACLAFGLIGTVSAAPGEYTIAAARLVEAPHSLVFATLARVDKFSQAVPGITEIEFLTNQHYGVGTRFRETRILNGKKATTELQVSELDEDKSIRMIANAGGTIWDTMFNVSQHGEGTQMEMEMKACPNTTMAKIITPMILGMVAKAVEADLDAVKRYCESPKQAEQGAS